jgi:hypothetical protein
MCVPESPLSHLVLDRRSQRDDTTTESSSEKGSQLSEGDRSEKEDEGSFSERSSLR